MTTQWITGRCINYRVYVDRGEGNDYPITVTDIDFDSSVIEDSDDFPCGLTASEVSRMILDLVDVLSAMRGDKE